MKQSHIIIVFVLLSVILAGCTTPAKDSENKTDVTVYKTATCGCCVGWSSYLDKEGFGIKTIVLDDISEIKAKHMIPPELESCHTAEVNGYFIEGHIPSEVIDRLLEEKPDIDGIALPRMPSGSPGMPGSKREPWVIYALKDGQYEVYDTI